MLSTLCKIFASRLSKRSSKEYWGNLVLDFLHDGGMDPVSAVRLRQLPCIAAWSARRIVADDANQRNLYWVRGRGDEGLNGCAYWSMSSCQP